MPKKLLLSLIVLFSIHTHAQDRRSLIFGKVVDTATVVKDVHIFNLTSRKGTISNEFGEFLIPVKENDTLLISDIQYESQRIIIDTGHLKNLQLTVYMKSKINELNEVEIKEHALTGNLTNDAKNALSESKINKVLQDPEAWKVDMRIVDDIDQMDMEKAPDSRKLTDPTAQGAQGSIFGLLTGLGINTLFNEISKIGQKKRAKKLAQTSYERASLEAPDKIRAELGDSFFTNTLKIPAQHIDGFIRYCTSKGIIDAYINNKKLALIDLLIQEHKNYLDTLEDDK